MNIPLNKGYVTVVDDDIPEHLVKLHWYVDKYGYARHSQAIYLGFKSYSCKILLLHREVMGATKGQVVDHINGDGLDNRRSNLRLCTVTENLWNTGMQKRNTSGFKGVTYHKGGKKWMAQIRYRGKNLYLGLHNTPEEAGEAYAKVAKGLHGEFYHDLIEKGAAEDELEV